MSLRDERPRCCACEAGSMAAGSLGLSAAIGLEPKVRQ